MPSPDEIKQNVLKLQTAGATPDDIEEYVKRATVETTGTHSFGGFMGNLASSAGNFVGNAYQAVRHPIDTATNLGAAAFGGVEKPIRLAGNAITGANTPPTPEEQKFDAIANQYRNRYGSIPQALETAYQDPVGTLADVSTVAGGIGGAAKMAGLGKVASAAGAVSDVTNPVNLAGKAARAVVPSGAAKTLSRKLYQSALKPTIGQAPTLEDMDALTNTAMRENIPVSRGGYAKAGEKIRGINQSIQNRIDTGAAAGDTISPYQVTPALKRSAAKFADQVNPQSDMNAISEAGNEFLGEYGGAPIPVDKAQRIKQGTYRRLEDKYGEIGSASIEGQKDLARGIKDAVYSLYPDLQAQGIREGELIDLQRAVERAAIREGKKDIVGVHGVSAAIPWLVKQLVDNPEIKSHVAIMLNRAAQRKASVPGAQYATPAAVAGAASQAVPQFADGTIAEQPTLGVIGEAGPEWVGPASAAIRTIPEKPETLKMQLDQLQAGKRKVVMFPKGTDMIKKPKGMKSFQDANGNQYIFNPKLTNSISLSKAVEDNRLPEILGATDGGMGAPDKSQIKGQPVAVSARDKRGNAAQTTVTDKDHLGQTIDQTGKVAPKGGSVDVEPPGEEAAARMDGLKSGEDVIRGSSNIPLTQEGLRQADELGRKLAGKGLKEIRTSDLLRARQTADAVALHTGAPIVDSTTALHPWHLGGLEGQPTNKVLAQINHYIAQEPDKPVPGRGPVSTADGESFNQFKARALGYIFNALQQGGGGADFTHYRVRKLVEAASKSGAKPPDFQINAMHMTGKGDPPGSVDVVRLRPNGTLALSPFNQDKDPIPQDGRLLVRHGKTAWNAEEA